VDGGLLADVFVSFEHAYFFDIRKGPEVCLRVRLKRYLAGRQGDDAPAFGTLPGSEKNTGGHGFPRIVPGAQQEAVFFQTDLLFGPGRA
jgi:hypothetical protein